MADSVGIVEVEVGTAADSRRRSREVSRISDSVASTTGGRVETIVVSLSAVTIAASADDRISDVTGSADSGWVMESWSSSVADVVWVSGCRGDDSKVDGFVVCDSRGGETLEVFLLVGIETFDAKAVLFSAPFTTIPLEGGSFKGEEEVKDLVTMASELLGATSPKVPSRREVLESRIHNKYTFSTDDTARCDMQEE